MVRKALGVRQGKERKGKERGGKERKVVADGESVSEQRTKRRKGPGGKGSLIERRVREK